MGDGTEMPHGYNTNKNSLQMWVRDILVGLCTAAVIASGALVLRLDKTMDSFITSHIEIHRRLDSIICDLKRDTAENRKGIIDLHNEFLEYSSRTTAEKYTVHQAFDEQKRTAEELKAIWDAIHDIKLDIVTLRKNGGRE